MSRPSPEPTQVAVSSLMLDLLEHASDPRFVPLGCAIPSPQLLASGRLDRFLARAARVKGVLHNVYTAPKGVASLRHEIARRALRWGQALSPDDIVVTCGCTEALALALSAVARAGDTIAIESPTYLFALALDKGICFAPGVVFSASGQHAHCLRLSGGYGWDPRIEKGIKALGAMARVALARS